MVDVRENMIAYRKHRLEEVVKASNFEYIDLTSEQENQLFKSIYNLSFDRQNLLIYKNYYNHSFDELEELFDIENAKGEYINLVCVLSEILDLDSKIISDSSIKKVCIRVAEKLNEEINKEFDFEILEKPKIKAKNRLRFNSFINSRVAIIVLILLVGSGTIIGANAYADGKIFEWVVSTFEKYTEVNITKESIVDKKKIDIEIGYISDNFTLADKSLLDSIDTYYYINGDKFLVIEFVYDNMNIKLDSEGYKKKQFEIDGNIVITWKKQNENYFLFNKNKVSCQIYGDIDKDEFLEIYKNISINKK